MKEQNILDLTILMKLEKLLIRCVQYVQQNHSSNI
ncbi:hypothetical protein SEEN536_01248 [Salmonella enterica subsp. enterica serovar Newport str. CVM 19536]|nr:hypothetical protein SEEN536_01248 [Salmonella enterica subsp. enterica serovar Newport str. CVM 19536]